MARMPRLPAGQVGVGDDAAVVEPPAGPLLLAADTLVEGVHADLGLTTTSDLGWKALAVNLSDLAAMGARPLHALVTVVVPTGRQGDLEELYVGLTEASEKFACPIIGGDLSSGPALVITVAVTGTVDDDGPGPVLRSGAKPGDHLFVTGPLGAASFELRRLRAGDRNVAGVHSRPMPRLAHGSSARLGGATAMMDLSDGLAIDARRLAVASGVGLLLSEIPVAKGATFEEAIGGGDDYELLIAAGDPERLVVEFRAAGLQEPLQIGACTEHLGDYRIGSEELPTGGWEHQW